MMHCARCVTFKMMFAHPIMSPYMIGVVGKQGIPGPEKALQTFTLFTANECLTLTQYKQAV